MPGAETTLAEISGGFVSASEVTSRILEQHPELSQSLNERFWTARQPRGSATEAAGEESAGEITLEDLCADESVIIRCTVAIPQSMKAGLGLRGACHRTLF